MSNRRKIKPPAFRPDIAPVQLRAEADGTLTVIYPKGRPDVIPVPPDALEALVDAHNTAVLAPRPDTPPPARRPWWRWPRG